MNANVNQMENVHEVELKAGGGLPVLIVNSLLMLSTIAGLVFGAILIDAGSVALGVALLVISVLYMCLVGPFLYMGLRIIRPNEAMVTTLFGRYIGTLRGAGYYFVNPFAAGVPIPSKDDANLGKPEMEIDVKTGAQVTRVRQVRRKLSLKAMTLENGRQKINDKLGNPIIIGIVVIWRVADTAKAMFNVDNFQEFLSIQCDSALRSIVRLYPYDDVDNDEFNEKSLRGSSVEISGKLREEIQEKVNVAGLEVMEARITHLAYAPEIAAAMLQRQQASAIVDARQLIVEGAVGMVEMALEKLGDKGIVQLDEERKAAMVSNLMVVLCGNRDAQPVVNSGSLY